MSNRSSNVAFATNTLLIFVLLCSVDVTLGGYPIPARYLFANGLIALAGAYLLFILEPILKRKP